MKASSRALAQSPLVNKAPRSPTVQRQSASTRRSLQNSSASSYPDCCKRFSPAPPVYAASHRRALANVGLIFPCCASAPGLIAVMPPAITLAFPLVKRIVPWPALFLTKTHEISSDRRTSPVYASVEPTSARAACTDQDHIAKPFYTQTAWVPSAVDAVAKCRRELLALGIGATLSPNPFRQFP